MTEWTYDIFFKIDNFFKTDIDINSKKIINQQDFLNKKILLLLYNTYVKNINTSKFDINNIQDRLYLLLDWISNHLLDNSLSFCYKDITKDYIKKYNKEFWCNIKSIHSMKNVILNNSSNIFKFNIFYYSLINNSLIIVWNKIKNIFSCIIIPYLEWKNNNFDIYINNYLYTYKPSNITINDIHNLLLSFYNQKDKSFEYIIKFKLYKSIFLNMIKKVIIIEIYIQLSEKTWIHLKINKTRVMILIRSLYDNEELLLKLKNNLIKLWYWHYIYDI
jgi:hypothetical protein